MNPAQKSRERLVNRLRDSADELAPGRMSHIIRDLRYAANELEGIGSMIEPAKTVWDVASRKGMLFSTGEDGTDTLVGFFVPARAMNELGMSIAAAKHDW